MDKDFRLEQAKTFILEGNVQSALYRVVSYLQDKEVYDQRPYQEPVKVRVERTKLFQPEDFLTGPMTIRMTAEEWWNYQRYKDSLQVKPSLEQESGLEKPDTWGQMAAKIENDYLDSKMGMRIGFKEPPQDTESPIKVNLSGVGTDSMTPMTRPSLQSGHGTMTQSHVEQVLKCVHEQLQALYIPRGTTFILQFYKCETCYALLYTDKTVVRAAVPRS